MIWVVDRVVDARDAARRAWLSAMGAHVRAGEKHLESARAQARMGHPELEAEALARAAGQRAKYEVALAAHPEWAAEVPAWSRGEAG